MPQVVDPSLVTLINARAYAALQTSRRNLGNTAYEWGTGVWTDQSYADPAWLTSLNYSKVVGLGTLATQNGTFSGTSSGTNTGDQSISSLGGTTIGSSVFTLTNPSAITFPRFNADNTTTALNAASFRSAIGAGTGDGTVTTIGVTTANGVSGSSSGGSTPNLTITLGAITPSTVNGNTITTGTGTLTLSTFTLTVAGTASISGTHTGTSSNTNTGDQTTISGNAGTATALATARAIYGNNFDGTAALTQIIASTFGGTGNGFAKFSGPTSTEKTFTLPDATCTILTSNGAVTVAQGGTGLGTLTANAVILGAGTGNVQFATIGTSGRLLIDQGVSVNPSFNAMSGDATITNAGAITITKTTPAFIRTATVTTGAAPTPNANTTDIYTVTALAEAATFGAPTGSPVEGQKLLIRIKDNGTARALAFNAIYRAGTIALPTTTILSKTMYLGFVFNASDTRWDFSAYVDNL